MIFKVNETQNVDFGDIDNSFFLIGLLNEFINRFQTSGDRFFKVLSWKQCFLLICVEFFKEPPILAEVADMLGCSHQNVKQMVIKLEKLGFVTLKNDETDKRKLRICLTQKAQQFSRDNASVSQEFMHELFDEIDKKELEITVKTIMKLDEKLKMSRFSK